MKGPAGASYRALFGLLGAGLRETPMLAAAAIGLCLVAGVFPVLTAYALGQLAEALQATLRSHDPTDGGATWWALCVAAVSAFGLVLDLARKYANRRLGREATGAVNRQLFEILGRPIGVEHLHEPSVRDAARRARGFGPIEVPIGDGLAGALNKLPVYVGALAAAALLCSLRWWLGLLILAVFAGMYLYLLRAYVRSTTATVSQAGVLRRSTYFRDLCLGPAAAQEVRLFELLPYFREAFSSNWRESIRELRRARHGYVISGLAAPVAAAALHAFAIAFAAWSDGLPGLVTAAMAMRVMGNLLSWTSDDIQMIYGAGAIGALQTLDGWLSLPRAASAAAIAPDFTQDLRLEGVAFQYPGASCPTLRGLDLVIPAGQSVTIVGLNGAGKTTLALVLAGLLTPTQGRVLIDGAPLEGPTQAAWQRRTAALFQDFVRYEATLAENIGFGSPDHLRDEPGVVRAGRRAGVAEIAAERPEGWRTPLTPNDRNGSDLSLGEWQRVAIARALFAVEHGSRLLLLDEPAASLDVRSEERLYGALLRQKGACTTVLVSHRLAGARLTDRIIVLEAGAIVEDGHHDELIAKGGRYAHLYALQAARIAGLAA